ncbi:MAG: hypothetical protein ACYCT2_09030 [Thermoplasmataceae archaeon]
MATLLMIAIGLGLVLEYGKSSIGLANTGAGLIVNETRALSHASGGGFTYPMQLGA